ncbi:E3 ubiquitin-protein ligase HOS1 isoform X2 [Ziziphus jujuba]|uniref:E3 ubiquitin-protein ligase HOS1 isoform X2 n=1 Tax=Ziziphus jujuba TaxID=326968 RepID=A0ABM4AC48_ZIZJJ|nr:E3 ubiquitin-protein ligase HOS1 isoform X2 [Ziziphus jujuba]
MDRRFNGPNGPSSSANGGSATKPAFQPPLPNYSSRAVQEALEHLASIDLIELCNEAKVERCRATRDLRSCGRYVLHVLNSCGHASLCAECSGRCDFCPICRIPIPKKGTTTRLRLYYECTEAGLISKRFDERFQEKDGEEQLTADVQHLYSLFDVALENNLVSLICHYITDVCMDESAVSSDPVIAFLLDEVVVKDWCKQTFQNIITELQGIYNLEVEELRTRFSMLLKYSVQLAGLSNVLEVLESSFKGSLSARFHDLHCLQESISKTKQHLEIMIWCIRHEFLANVRSRYSDLKSWHSSFRERKSAAIKRSWPDVVNNSEESARHEGTLFIEDALANLEIECGYTPEMGEELKVAYLQKDGISLIFRSQMEGISGCYPFENLRAAVDILFLCGSSGMVVAKQAIFLYYLFDRHWTMPDEEWRHILEDFAASFSITRNLLLESLIFYLLDDHTEEAVLEACHLLPEISGPSTHPKIAQVLLERGHPDAALLVLRCSGHDGTSQIVSLSDAVTAVRVRVESGLLTEAFLHQRMLCAKVREKKLKYGPSADVSDDSKVECRSWRDWVEVLVTEICYLCIRRNMVDRMIELPWNSDEEKHLHKCLLDFANGDPSSIVGSLLVIFYIQRYRYSEAYQVDLILKGIEQEFISKNSVSDDVLSRMRLASCWRAALVDKCVALLPEVHQQQVKAAKLHEVTVATDNYVESPVKSDLPEVQFSKSTSLLIPSSNNSNIVPWTDHATVTWKPASFETPIKRGGSFENYHSEFGNYGSSILHGKLFSNAEERQKPLGSVHKSFNFEDKSTPRIRHVSAVNSTPLTNLNRRSSRVFPGSNLLGNPFESILPETEHNRIIDQLQNISSSHQLRDADLANTPSKYRGLFKDSPQDIQQSVFSKTVQPDRDDRPLNIASSEDLMNVSWRNLNGGPRWRSDEASDDEEGQSPQRATESSYHATPTRGTRRNRFARR